MPHRPRALFPRPSNATECHINCTHECLFYELCPLPHPLPPLPPLPLPPPSTSIHLHHFPRILLALLIPSALLIILSLLFFSLCLFFAHRRRRLRHSDPDPPPAPLPFHINPPDITPDSDQHYVWYIRTVGLDDSAISAISAWSYKSGDAGKDASMEGCTVCLGEFHDGELLRLLPKCGHAFHVSCIDTWLRAHASCPLCREAVVAPPPGGFPMPPRSPSNIGGDSSDSEIPNTGDGIEQGNTASSSHAVRRSASMGSLACKGGNFEEGSASNSTELKVCLGFEVELVRSWSCSGNRFFLSRHGRG